MKRVSLLLVLLLVVPVMATAQVPGLNLPDPSPEASVSQAIGLTEINVTYHRPGVNGRQIWGGLVPYDTVWRAGANENTTVSFSTPVTVNGKKLEAGVYGFHLIPARGDWTVIFSNESGAWGSFSYDEAEDATRVTAKPAEAALQERLSYTFDDPTADSVTLAMRWEKVRLPVEIKIDRARTVLEDLKAQLRGLPRFGWQAWNQAANWALQNNIDIDDAIGWADRSISLTRNFANLNTKAQLLEKKGQTAEAETLMAEATQIATEAEMNTYGYQLIGQQKTDEAIVVFQKNVKDHPDSWNVYDSLAEAYGLKGEKRKAIEYYTKALNLTTDETQKSRISSAIEQLKN